MAGVGESNTLKYAKVCDAGRLTIELIKAGITQSPTPGFKMYGVSVEAALNVTFVFVIDNLPAPDIATINAVVAAHVNTPLKEPTPTENFITNAKLVWLSTTQVGIGTDGILSRARNSDDTFDITWMGQLEADIAVLGAGGLDTGSPASKTWYAVYVIDDSTGVNDAAALLSASSTSPTLPSGYDVFRRLGWVRRDANGLFLKFVQIGNDSTRVYYYDESSKNLHVLTNGQATIFTTISLSAVVPPGVREVSLRIHFRNLLGKADDEVRIRMTGSSQTSPVNEIAAGLILSAFQKGQLDVVCDEGQNIDYMVTSALNVVNIGVEAFTDEL